MIVLLATWLAWCRANHPPGRLRALEAGSVFLYTLGMASSVAVARTVDAGGTYSLLLAFTSVVIGRAVLIPSTPARTLGLSTVSALPVLVASWIFDHSPRHGRGVQGQPRSLEASGGGQAPPAGQGGRADAPPRGARGKVFDVAKVVDFGLVKDLQAQEPVELTGADDSALTRTMAVSLE